MGFKLMQIETSNHCSLHCRYCPHFSQTRQQGNMSMQTFRKCMELVRRSDNPANGGRKFVWLNHFGEPLLNPELPALVAHATSCGIDVSFSSNGTRADGSLFPRRVWQELADAGLKTVILSAHVASESALREQVGDIVNVTAVWQPNRDFMHDWAGQVDISAFNAPVLGIPAGPCDYALHDMFAVTWDGRLASCCYDAEARVGLTIDDVLANGFSFRANLLCRDCRLGRGDATWLEYFPPAAG